MLKHISFQMATILWEKHPKRNRGHDLSPTQTTHGVSGNPSKTMLRFAACLKQQMGPIKMIPAKKNYKHMDVWENSGTPKSSILIVFSIINHPFWGTPILGNPHIISLEACSSAGSVEESKTPNRIIGQYAKDSPKSLPVFHDISVFSSSSCTLDQGVSSSQ